MERLRVFFERLRVAAEELRQETLVKDSEGTERKQEREASAMTGRSSNY